MKKEKKDYLELNCQNFTERGFNIIVTSPHMKYYGRIHEVKCSPNVLHLSSALALSNLQQWANWDEKFLLSEETGTESRLLYCNPASNQKLTITGVSKGAASFTIDLSAYNREQVLKFLTDHGVMLENEDVKV